MRRRIAVVPGWKSDQVSSAAAGYWVHRAGPGCWQSAAESKRWNCTTRSRRSCQKSSRKRMWCILFFVFLWQIHPVHGVKWLL